MWRITHLTLENISYIWSGSHKNKVDIDFEKANSNSKLNMIIGPMGSGKSVILGHLQPFASFGTLDVRNSESMVLPEVNGLKVIEYLHDGHTYTIHHDYIWNNSTKAHNIKSYIEKDGVELNPNGNSGSFKEIIKAEFGIDQSFLRVLRLGPNVANVISMKAAERKKFIASLQEDTEMYLMIHKKLSDDYRTLKASITSVSNRLMQLSATKEDSMREELTGLQEDYNELIKLIDENKATIARLQGVNSTLGGDNVRSLENQIDDLKATRTKLVGEITEIQEILDDISGSNETLEHISGKIGGLRATTTALEQKAIELNRSMEETGTEINKIYDQILAHDNDAHLDSMRDELHKLEEEYNRYSVTLDGFSCKYEYHFLAKFIDDLTVLRNQVEEMAQVDPKLIRFLIGNADKSLGTTITTKIGALTGRKVNLQKAISNVKFSAEYVSPFPLFRDPRCTFDQCPYFTTHPVTVNKDIGTSKDRDAMLARYQDEMDRIDVEIAKYQEIPILQKQVQLLLNMWKSAFPVLVELGVVSSDLRLMDLLTDASVRNDWYHYSQLISILEKCKMRAEYDEVAARYASVKNEIAIIESPEYSNTRSKYDELNAQYEKTRRELYQVQADLEAAKDQVTTYEAVYAKIQKRDIYEGQLHTAQESLESTEESLAKLSMNLQQIHDNTREIHGLEAKGLTLDGTYRDLTTRMDRLKTILSQIEYNQQEYQGLLEQSKVMKIVLDAVSSKNGIPLILVKHFLNGCRDIVNDLIAEVFDDDLEILDFDVTEDDFKIPYVVNGQIISDISYASQGQQSIISIALSFALVRQSMFDYNIMLLDEIDGPLHKNDREKFIGILFRQMAAIQADQVFLISHNSTFEGNPVNLIMTADEDVEPSSRQVVIHV